MKWVTFYYDAMSDKIYDFVEHKDKVSVTEYFKKVVINTPFSC